MGLLVYPDRMVEDLFPVYPDQRGEDLLQAYQVDVGPSYLTRFENISSWAGAVIERLIAKHVTPPADGAPR